MRQVIGMPAAASTCTETAKNYNSQKRYHLGAGDGGVWWCIGAGADVRERRLTVGALQVVESKVSRKALRRPMQCMNEPVAHYAAAMRDRSILHPLNRNCT